MEDIARCPPVILPHRDGLVDYVYVTPGWRKQGIGTRPCRMLLSWFAEEGIEEVRIHYQVSKREALRFWERFGFGPWTIQARLRLSGETGPGAREAGRGKDIPG